MTKAPRPIPTIKPRHFPPPPPLIQKTPGLWRRTPPALFAPIMGMLGLGLAWRTLASQPGLHRLAPIGELLLGASLLLFGFALVAWLSKPLRRPGVVIEELTVLPGRAGMAAMALCFMLAAAALRPHAPDLALWLVWTGIATLGLVGVLVAYVLLRGPVEQRVVSPVFHLTYVGYIIAPLSLIPLGYTQLSTAILYATIAIAMLIWAVSAGQLIARVPPAPLRPLLAIHLSPASLFATVSAQLGMPTLAFGFACLSVVLLAALLVGARWMLQSGFSPMWGALTFPLAATVTASILSLGAAGLWLGAVLLIGASALNPWVATRVVKLWAKGELGAKTNAATV